MKRKSEESESLPLLMQQAKVDLSSAKEEEDLFIFNDTIEAKQGGKREDKGVSRLQSEKIEEEELEKEDKLHSEKRGGDDVAEEVEEEEAEEEEEEEEEEAMQVKLSKIEDETLWEPIIFSDDEGEQEEEHEEGGQEGGEEDTFTFLTCGGNTNHGLQRQKL